jgi:lipopolysaccharide/colanic/teichoic acid biosynthesis glycosyltransferase
MRAILDRERMRCDRGRSTFVLLKLTLSRHCEESELAVVARIVSDRIRLTDDAGLLGARSIGVVLPETPVSGAWKLAEGIRDLLPSAVRRPKCNVYLYPSHRKPADIDEDADTDRPKNRQKALPMHELFVQPLPMWKRAMDIVGAVTGIALAVPLMLLIAVMIKATSRGPIIFTQKRDTAGGRQFTIYKFRTMSVDAEQRKSALRPFSEQDGPAFKIAKDPRITPLGRLLRATSIDELPQLFNVLVGDMSLVGPRPLPCDESSRCEPWQQRRLDVTPGLTCIWQVRGRSAVSFSEWIRMDVKYIRSRSLVTDVKLILQTIPAVALRRGGC